MLNISACCWIHQEEEPGDRARIWMNIMMPDVSPAQVCCCYCYVCMCVVCCVAWAMYSLVCAGVLVRATVCVIVFAIGLVSIMYDGSPVVGVSSVSVVCK